MPEKKKIVILGAGFGGIYTLQFLHKFLHASDQVEIYVVDEHNYFLFTPLLHEVATGGQTPGNIVEPIRKILGCCVHRFYLGRAKRINTEARTVELDNVSLPYDYLIVATGATTNFYHIPGAKEFSFTLKSIEDAVKLKNHLIAQVERASQITDRDLRRKMLRFVVVGGGPTGVELVAEIAELVKDTFSRYYTCGVLEDISIMLVELGKELVPQFGPKIRAKSLEVLRKKGIEVMFESPVVEVGMNYILLDGGRRLDTETPIWIAGVEPQYPDFDTAQEKTPDGRLLVDEFFALKNEKNIFALGDISAFTQDGKLLPQLAQVAERQAKALAKNLARTISGKPTLKFRYRHSGYLLSLGEWMAAGEIGGFTFHGRFTWWLWRTIYLFKFISLRKKFLVALDWTVHLFLPRDISEL